MKCNEFMHYFLPNINEFIVSFANAMDTFFLFAGGFAGNGTRLPFCFIFRPHSSFEMSKVLHFFPRRCISMFFARSVCSIYSGCDELLALVYGANFVSMFEFEMDL